MGAAGCRKNANFGGDSNPWALDTLNLSKDCKFEPSCCSFFLFFCILRYFLGSGGAIDS